jgi:hypothetical protein
MEVDAVSMLLLVVHCASSKQQIRCAPELRTDDLDDVEFTYSHQVSSDGDTGRRLRKFLVELANIKQME